MGACIALSGIILVAFASYIITGIILKADVPIVRNLTQPEVVSPVNTDASYIVDMWEDMKVYQPTPYEPLFTDDETEDEFYTRMSDIDRRSLHQLAQKYPELLVNGLSNISFDVTQTPVSQLLDSETDEKLKTDLLAGGVKTNEGHPILAIDGTKSMLLIGVEINDTDGFMAISYDKSKVKLSVTSTAFEGWWGTMKDHIKQNDGAVVAIPANNYTYNARAGYGVVAGGFLDTAIPRYKMSGNMSYYMGFTRDGNFVVGDKARYGCINFSEGLGVLLQDDEIPIIEVVPKTEQDKLFELLASYIKTTGENPEDEGYDGVAVIQEFIETFDNNLMKAKASWVIKNKTIEDAYANKLVPEDTLDILTYAQGLESGAGISKELKEAVQLIEVCDSFGASHYVQDTSPVRSAYNAIGQRATDGAIVLFGIGGAKRPDSRNLPGNGATVDEMQQLLLAYNVTNAAITTSGDRVGFGWKDQSLLHVQDTTSEGGRSYGAYILK